MMEFWEAFWEAFTHPQISEFIIVALVYALSLTLAGIYALYWLAKQELNKYKRGDYDSPNGLKKPNKEDAPIMMARRIAKKESEPKASEEREKTT